MGRKSTGNRTRNKLHFDFIGMLDPITHAPWQYLNGFALHHFIHSPNWFFVFVLFQYNGPKITLNKRYVSRAHGHTKKFNIEIQLIENSWREMETIWNSEKTSVMNESVVLATQNNKMNKCLMINWVCSQKSSTRWRTSHTSRQYIDRKPQHNTTQPMNND